MSYSTVTCDSGDLNLDSAVNSWLRNDRNPKSSKEVADDVQAQNWSKLRLSMLSRQKFGTAGMRSRMAPGYKFLNDLVILQTAQGLCSYLQKQSNQAQLHNGVVIGFDGRYNSRRFAELTAKVFTSSSIPVHMFSSVCPTPLVSFATVRLGAAAGVMVTASHNPREDNGYKVYWSNGSQIISPHDVNILEEILQCLEVPEEHWNIGSIWSDKLVSDCLQDMTTAYMDYIKDSLLPDVKEQNKKAAIDVVYSAMHGVGYKFIVKAFEMANLKPPISVKQQQNPNPEFSTVMFPNPEEFECMVLSKQLAESERVKLVLINDPDADRLAVAEFDYSKKEWKIFSGNEMGALLGWWLLQQYYNRHPDVDCDDVYVLCSVVSSKMLRAVVQGRGQLVETLTGFKWMGNTTLLLKQQGKVPLFAFEEAIGYMCDPLVPDKDGVSAAVQVASLASSLYSKGSSLKQQLGDLYKQYGYHLTHNSYFICKDPVIVQKIFRRIRNYDGPGKYPKEVGSSEIVFINDFSAGFKTPERANGDAHLNVLGTGLDQDYTNGEMVMFRTADGLHVTVRTSGTEPKIKYYAELVHLADTYSEEEELKIQSKLKTMVQEFIEELLQPTLHGLAPAPDFDRTE